MFVQFRIVTKRNIHYNHFPKINLYSFYHSYSFCPLLSFIWFSSSWRSSFLPLKYFWQQKRIRRIKTAANSQTVIRENPMYSPTVPPMSLNRLSGWNVKNNFFIHKYKHEHVVAKLHSVPEIKKTWILRPFFYSLFIRCDEALILLVVTSTARRCKNNSTINPLHVFWLPSSFYQYG